MTLVHRQTLKKKIRLPLSTCSLLSHANPLSSFPPITSSSLSNCHTWSLLSTPPVIIVHNLPSIYFNYLSNTSHYYTGHYCNNHRCSLKTNPPLPLTEPLSGTVACSPGTWTQLETENLHPVPSKTRPHTVKAACQGLLLWPSPAYNVVRTRACADLRQWRVGRNFKFELKEGVAYLCTIHS